MDGIIHPWLFTEWDTIHSIDILTVTVLEWEDIMGLLQIRIIMTCMRTVVHIITTLTIMDIQIITDTILIIMEDITVDIMEVLEAIIQGIPLEVTKEPIITDIVRLQILQADVLATTVIL